MQSIKIEATSESPAITLDIEKGIFSIKGKSIISNVEEFYSPILDWLEEIESVLPKKIDFVFDLDCFNMESSKKILALLYKLKKFKEIGTTVHIVWNFSDKDEDMKEIGEDFSFISNIPFEFISKTSKAELV